MFRSKAERKVLEAGYDPSRLPPGQYLTEKWPVLHAGGVPDTDLATWDFFVSGEVENPIRMEIGYLHANLDLTIVMITHDVDSLFGVCDRVAVLVNKGIIVDTLDEIVKHPDPWIQEYFGDPRAVRARRAARHRARTSEPYEQMQDD